MVATTSSEFWGPYANAYSLLVDRMPRLNEMRRVVNRDGYRATKELFDELIGATAGATAAASHKRVEMGEVVNGGNPNAPLTTTVTDINRATTAADVTALKAIVDLVSVRPVPYARDLSGNGGPSLS
jgi:hypothetical protein